MQQVCPIRPTHEKICSARHYTHNCLFGVDPPVGPSYLLIFCLGRHVRRPMVQFWHRGVCALIGMKVTCYGKPSQSKRVLLAGNHVSYLDIPIIASCLDVTFVAKAEVADWPLFGFLAQIAQTAFIERRPSKARKQKPNLNSGF